MLQIHLWKVQIISFKFIATPASYQLLLKEFQGLYYWMDIFIAAVPISGRWRAQILTVPMRSLAKADLCAGTGLDLRTLRVNALKLTSVRFLFITQTNYINSSSAAIVTLSPHLPVRDDRVRIKLRSS
jgi:hypothetical protein